MEACRGVLVDAKRLLFAVAFVEKDVTTGWALEQLRATFKGARDGFGKASPLAKVTRGVKVCHARCVMRDGVALAIADDEEPVLLVEVCDEEVLEESANELFVLGQFVIRNPVVSHSLENEADGVHLAVAANAIAVAPAEAVLANDVREEAKVALGVGAQAWEFAVSQVDVGMQLEGGADEDELHDTVEVINSAKHIGTFHGAWAVVTKATGSVGFYTFKESFNEASCLIFFREAEGVARNSLGDIESLEMGVVVATVQEAFVE